MGQRANLYHDKAQGGGLEHRPSRSLSRMMTWAWWIICNQKKWRSSSTRWPWVTQEHEVVCSAVFIITSGLQYVCKLSVESIQYLKSELFWQDSSLTWCVSVPCLDEWLLPSGVWCEFTICFLWMFYYVCYISTIFASKFILGWGWKSQLLKTTTAIFKSSWQCYRLPG